MLPNECPRVYIRIITVPFIIVESASWSSPRLALALPAPASPLRRPPSVRGPEHPAFHLRTALLPRRASYFLRYPLPAYRRRRTRCTHNAHVARITPNALLPHVVRRRACSFQTAMRSYCGVGSVCVSPPRVPVAVNPPRPLALISPSRASPLLLYAARPPAHSLISAAVHAARGAHHLFPFFLFLVGTHRADSFLRERSPLVLRVVPPLSRGLVSGTTCLAFGVAILR
ncbi:hypothetical protein DFH09DRAFT_437404 [Mycena vulgaris]|nr:hypothetical protein DFH09DRAFT_437404 [Mycena vulgaris]